MAFIVLVFVGIVFLLTFFWASCNTKTQGKNEKVRVLSTSDSVVNLTDVVEKQLKRSDTSIGKIENTIHERDALVKENVQLKKELKDTKDSLVATKKLIKKRTLIQKILGTNKDSVQKNVSDTAN